MTREILHDRRASIRSTRAVIAALAALAASGCAHPVSVQGSYASADAAASAFAAALETREPAALSEVLGPDWKQFVPDAGIGDEEVGRYLSAWKTRHVLVPGEGGKTFIAVGERGWTLPIPLVPSGDGWRFDVEAGAEEIRTRRIGRNELAAINAALAYADAQREYAERDRDGDGVLEYAQRIVSTPGEQDGLYWASLDGEEESPLGPLFGQEEPGTDYRGYYFRILTEQGERARGGAYDYLLSGRMVGGFALIAWPARYDDTGVMSFIVNHDGVVYQADLGDETDASARATRRFDPGPEWQVVEPPA